MKKKMEIDHNALAGIRHQREQERFHSGQGPPSIAAMEERFLHEMVNAALCHALRMLSSADRELIVHVKIEGVESAQEYADRYDLASSTVYRRIPKAIEKLRKILKSIPIFQEYLRDPEGWYEMRELY